MKQAEDIFTIDMLGDSLTAAQQLAVMKHEAFHAMRDIMEAERKAEREQPAPSKYRFRFYVTTREGATIEWVGLTAKRAKDMYAYTSQSQPSNVTAFGWEELK
jgi:hypothetical protein